MNSIGAWRQRRDLLLVWAWGGAECAMQEPDRRPRGRRRQSLQCVRDDK